MAKWLKLYATYTFSISPIRCPQPLKEKSYKAIVRPELEHCCCIWDPYRHIPAKICGPAGNGSAQSCKIRQKCTSSAHQTAYFSVCYGQRLRLGTTSNPQTPYGRLNMFFKITRGMVELPSEYHPFPRHQLAARGHSRQFQRLQPSVDDYKYAFFPRIIPFWNALPVELVEAESLEAFKLRLQSLQ